MSLALKIALSPLLVAQAMVTRRRTPRLPEPEGPRQGVEGEEGAAPLRLRVAGDSSAAGVGVARQQQALAQPLAAQLARLCRARVHWDLQARTGWTTAQTVHHLLATPLPPADVAVIVTGVNDVVERVSVHEALRTREALVRLLRDGQGVAHVVFAPLPPVHRFPALPQPLRWVAGADAARHNRALRRWARAGEDLSFLDDEMALDESAMAVDGFHPGEPVYRHLAEALARHIATHAWPQLRSEPAP